jgi:hypothetical protein
MTSAEMTSAEMTSAAPTSGQPLFQITSGSPTADEVAAVTVLLLAIARSQTASAPPAQPVGGWADPARRLRRPLSPGPGAWRASAW